MAGSVCRVRRVRKNRCCALPACVRRHLHQRPPHVSISAMDTNVKKWAVCWVLVKELNLSYHDKETILFTIDPHYCDTLLH